MKRFLFALKKLFYHRKYWDPYYVDENSLKQCPRISQVLSKEEQGLAMGYFAHHKEQIKNMMLETTEVSYPEPEDKNDPRLWLPTHWNWFLNKNI